MAPTPPRLDVVVVDDAIYIVGQAAQQYFALGRSWGPKGPKRIVQDILDRLDRDSLLGEAREQILARLRVG